MSDTFELYDLGDFELQGGVTLPAARLAYRTHGTLNAARDNAIVMPSAFNGEVGEYDGWMAPGMALDPAKYFVIVAGLFGNGQSSSPGNTPVPFDGPRFPNATIADNVRAQHRLVTEKFGIERIKLVAGFSMGAIQTFHWGALYPDMVERIAPFCGAARCSRHNYVFLAGLRAALTADQNFNGGQYLAKPAAGLAAFGRVYAGWAFSQAFYRQKIDLEAMGFASTDDFLSRYWDQLFIERDANDLMLMTWAWQHGDIADNALYGGDFPRALAAITAKAIIMPSATDLYFPVADSELEIKAMSNARVMPIPSVWGHVAGAVGANAADTAFINARFAELLAG